MKVALLGAGVVACVVGLAIWIFPVHRVMQPNWIPISAPISLVSHFSLHTNGNANTPGRYFLYFVFDTASLDLKDDNPKDTFDHPRRIPIDVELGIADEKGVLLTKHLTEVELGSEGAETVDYRLVTFDLKQPGQVMISISNTPSPISVGTGNPRLEMRLSAATYQDRLIGEAVGRRLGIPVVVVGFVVLITGLLWPSHPLREDAE